MYTACLFCNGPLGSNEAIERFPVGGRLAFDVERGRLWVVCPRCARWNLTPLEERWEAVEQCEREFRGTRVRASTTNIALGRLSSGLVLIRVGQPPGPEIATWRYAASFAKRYRRVTLAAMALGGTLGLAAGVTHGLALAFTFGAGGYFTRRAVGYVYGLRTAHVIPRGELPPDRFSVDGVCRARLVPGVDGAWSLRIDPTVGPTREFTGDAAKNVLRKTLPYVNSIMASPKNVVTAIERLTASASPEAYIRLVAGRSKRAAAGRPLVELLPKDRLALEMAVTQETERRALEGELAPLEAAWREAEEIAAIADNLFLPESVREWMQARGRE